jgi:hypothetical protein
MSEQEPGGSDGPAGGGGTHLRLVWSNPAPRPVPRRPMDLAAAIERQIGGEYGLSDADFARVFARTACGGDARRPIRVL